MTEERQRPERDPRIIAAAIEKATETLSKGIISAVNDRGGSPADIADLLGRINAVVIATLTDGVPDARAKSEALINLISENSLSMTRKIRTNALLRNLPNPKGLRS